MTGEREGKALLRKMRFLEWLSTKSDVTALEWRVAVLLVSHYHDQRGFAWPTLDQIADKLAVRRTSIVRVIDALTEKGVFEVTKGGGRGRANEYRPRFDRVPEGDIYDHACAETVSERRLLERESVSQETVSDCAETVSPRSVNSLPQETPSVSTSGLSTSAPLSWRRTDARRATKTNDQEDMAKLKTIERGLENAPTIDQLRIWDSTIEEIIDRHGPAQTGPLAGLAYRIAQEVGWLISQHEAGNTPFPPGWGAGR